MPVVQLRMLIDFRVHSWRRKPVFHFSVNNCFKFFERIEDSTLKNNFLFSTPFEGTELNLRLPCTVLQPFFLNKFNSVWRLLHLNTLHIYWLIIDR